MQGKSRVLTVLEQRYAEKQISSSVFGMRNVKYVYLLLIVVGIIFTFSVEQPLFGMAILFVGVIGGVFFSQYSESMKFTMEPETRWITGKLKFKRAGKGFVPYLGNHRIFCPAVFESRLQEIARKKKKVSVELALCQYTRKQEKGTFHIPLRIEDELCVLNALNQYGIRFSLLPSILFILKLIGGVACFGVLVIPVFLLTELFNDPWKTIIFMILMFPALFIGFWVAFKILPDDEILIKRRLNCTTDAE